MEARPLDAIYCSRRCRQNAKAARSPGRAARRKRYRLRYPEKRRVDEQVRRARERNAPGGGLTADQWLDMVAEMDECCAYCGETTTDPHLEHVIPLSRGGWHDISNIVPACPSCNLSKATKTGHEFKPDWIPPHWVALPERLLSCDAGRPSKVLMPDQGPRRTDLCT